MLVRFNICCTLRVVNFLARFHYIGKCNPLSNSFCKNVCDTTTGVLIESFNTKLVKEKMLKALEKANEHPCSFEMWVTPEAKRFLIEFKILQPHENSTVRQIRYQTIVLEHVKSSCKKILKMAKIPYEIRIQDHRQQLPDIVVKHLNDLKKYQTR